MFRFALLLFAALLGTGAPALLQAQPLAPKGTSPAAAEWTPAAVTWGPEDPGRGSESSPVDALVGALVGGVVLPAVGGLVGHALAPGDPGGYISPGLVNGVALGLLFGPPIGAHIANRREGDLLFSILGATAGTVVLAYAVRESGREPGSILLSVPVSQIALSAAIEYLTGR